MVAKRKGKTTPATRLVPETADVPIGEIDPTPATKVRARLIQDAVDEYAALDESGTPFWDPATAVHYCDRGRDVYLLADGRHRLEARKRNRRETLHCDVYRCGSQADAERLAYELAAKANAHPGMKRSEADSWAAIETILLRPEFGAGSDYKIVQLTRTYAGLVRRVREKLTYENRLPPEARSDSPDRYKNETAHIGGGRRSDGKGGTMPSHPPTGTPVQAASPPEEGEVIRSDDFAAGLTCYSDDEPKSERADDQPAGVVSTSPPTTSHPPAVVGDEGSESPTSPQVADAKGRPLPPHLIPIFGKLPAFRSFVLQVGKLFQNAEALADDPAGAGVRPQMSNIEKFCNDLKGAVSAGSPYVVCPACDGAGRQGSKGPCRTCSVKGGEGRGWLTRLNYMQLPPELKAACEKYGSNDRAA